MYISSVGYDITCVCQFWTFDGDMHYTRLLTNLSINIQTSDLVLAPARRDSQVRCHSDYSGAND